MTSYSTSTPKFYHVFTNRIDVTTFNKINIAPLSERWIKKYLSSKKLTNFVFLVIITRTHNVHPIGDTRSTTFVEKNRRFIKNIK